MIDVHRIKVPETGFATEPRNGDLRENDPPLSIDYMLSDPVVHRHSIGATGEKAPLVYKSRVVVAERFN
jgi:hypothetical protein